MPMRCRELRFEGDRVFVSVRDLPEPAEDEMLVRTTFSLPSVGTELAALRGHPWSGNQIGYSSVGVIEQAGRGMRRRIGERIHCVVPHADWTILPDRAVVYPVPESVSDEDATFATLGAVAMHIVERAEIALGQAVAVAGLGSVGLLIVQLARMAGAGVVIGIDPVEERRAQSLRHGASQAAPPSTEQLRRALDGSARGSAPPVFIEASGATQSVEWMVDAAPLHSRIVLAGTYLQPAHLHPFALIEKELSIVGAHQPKCPQTRGAYYPYNREFNYDFVLRSIAENRLNVADLRDGVLNPDQAPAWYASALNGNADMRQPIFDWR